jgi:hypothetical protein
VADAVKYRYRDTPERGFRAYLPVPLARGQETLGRDYHSRDIADWITPSRVGLRYYDVCAYREGPDGLPVYEAREKVPYVGVEPPLPGQTLYVPIEGSGEEGFAEARAIALREATSTGRGLFRGEMTLPSFDPLIGREDRFTVAARREDPNGDVYEELYICSVDSPSHTLGTETSGSAATIEGLQSPHGSASSGAALETRVVYSALLLEEDRVRKPALIVPAAPGTELGVLATPRDPYGTDGDDLYFDVGLLWPTVDGDDLVLDSAGPVSVDGDDLVLTDAGL